jgi:hypothetical protein
MDAIVQSFPKPTKELVMPDLTYKEWFKQLDALFTAQFGLGVNDFPDYMWCDEWECDNTPEDSFHEWCLQTNWGLNA